MVLGVPVSAFAAELEFSQDVSAVIKPTATDILNGRLRLTKLPQEELIYLGHTAMVSQSKSLPSLPFIPAVGFIHITELLMFVTNFSL